MLLKIRPILKIFSQNITGIFMAVLKDSIQLRQHSLYFTIQMLQGLLMDAPVSDLMCRWVLYACRILNQHKDRCIPTGKSRYFCQRIWPLYNIHEFAGCTCNHLYLSLKCLSVWSFKKLSLFFELHRYIFFTHM